MSDLLPLFPLPNVVLFPNVFLPLHIFEPRYREMVADALAERPDDRHGAAAAGLGARLRGAAAGLSDRLQRRASRTSSGCPTAATTSCCAARAVPDRRGGSRAAAIAARAIEPLRDAAARRRRPRRDPRRSARSSSRCSAPAGRARRRAIRRMPAAMSDEDLVNALAQYLDLEPLEKQALLEQHVPAHARRVAGRAARDEDHDGAHARPVERRALSLIS